MKKFILLLLIVVTLSCSVNKMHVNTYYEKYSFNKTNLYMNNMKKNKKLWNEYQKAEHKIETAKQQEEKYVNNLRQFAQ